MPLGTRAAMSAWSSAKAALVIKATRPASARANLLFRIIDFLSLVFDDRAVVQKEGPVGEPTAPEQSVDSRKERHLLSSAIPKPRVAWPSERYLLLCRRILEEKPPFVVQSDL